MKCKICNSTNITIAYNHFSDKNEKLGSNFSPTCRDFGIFYDILKCNNCGIFFSSLVINANKAKEMHFDSVDNLYALQSAERNIAYNYILSRIKKLIFKKEPTLLDIGCSYGLFLKLAKESSFKVCGVELSKDACSFCKEKLKLDVLCGTVDSVNLADNSYDVITALEVIEHVEDPKEFIFQTKRILKPGGILYLITPNKESFSGRLLRSRWWSYRQMHLYYFSRKTLFDLLKKNGFSLVHSEPYKKIFKINYILQQLLGYNKILYYFLNGLCSMLQIKNRMITLSYGDIAIIARKDKSES